ncbi:hypothetical protein TRM7557_02755 [Tritonibacter multivorans]|uniref:FG-GAP repeat n=1 Tax=Tritonibacter multivorans TaxID=928856 RepID=A0A0P1GF70_9RHOB|nr:FG-GAP-like repeat-containing protein [Tritonibacter multivorans]MDA7421101.1 FG-GAP-like repeat-containing protein [Tritonibacter multivorans]CUH80171.1 hypothetical protein TRM7557_02755 [Tritonibacter multivorans]SFC75227.1 Repeat domain-containing protein [Tritonibacter multivorans]
MPLPIPDSPVEAGFAASLNLGRNEAEDMSIDGGFAVRSNPHASSDKFLQATADISRAGGVFDGAAGTYDLTVGYFDETDGVSCMEVVVNGVVVDSFDWDSTAGRDLVTPSGLQEQIVASVWLEPGDLVVLRGRRDGGEPLRTDYLDIAPSDGPPPPPPSSDPFVIEAETLEILSGFKVVSNPVASDDAFLQAKKNVEARACHTVEQAGTFDLTIGYFDETDGMSNMRVLVNGVEVDNFDWDSASGSSVANAASRAERKIEDLELAVGDKIELVGMSDGKEPLRTDFLRFEPTSAPPPAPPSADVWFVDGSEVKLGLNDGDGTFTIRATGITPGSEGTVAADFDGNGSIDFLTLNVTVPPDPGVTDIFTFETTLHANDGSAVFTDSNVSSITTSALFPNIFFDGEALIAHDARDVDGDGDADVLAIDENGDTAFLLENDGSGNFSVLTRSAIASAFGLEALIGEFTGDTAGDIVVLTGPDPSSVDIYVNDGVGNLTAAGSRGPSPETHFDGEILDLDGDGDLDVLFVANGEGRGIFALLNDGTGNTEAGAFPGVDVDEDGLVGLVEGGNFDGDDTIEIISAGASDSSLAPGLRVYEFVDTGGGKDFVLQSFDPTITGNVHTAADYDGDGDLDLLLSTDAMPNTLSLLENDGNAVFTNTGVVLATDDVADETYFFDDTPLV